MINTLNMPAHERLRLLRNGEKVLCKKCKKGPCYLLAIVKKQILFIVIFAKTSSLSTD